MLVPSKGILMASRDGCLPEKLGKLNKKHVPINILLLQGVLFTGMCTAYFLLPTVSSAFWVLTNITSILALVLYVLMFSAAIYLRYKYPHVKRAFKVPGGKFGLWFVCLLGLFSSLFTIVLGFFPPNQIHVGKIQTYESIVMVVFILGCLLPILIYAINKGAIKHKLLAVNEVETLSS